MSINWKRKKLNLKFSTFCKKIETRLEIFVQKCARSDLMTDFDMEKMNFKSIKKFQKKGKNRKFQKAISDIFFLFINFPVFWENLTN